MPDAKTHCIYVAYSLGSREQFAQIEKQGLSTIFGVTKFNQHLYGWKFILITDLKALVEIFYPNKGISRFSANRLRSYCQYTIEYIKSNRNPADSLSRLTIEKADTDLEIERINFVNYFCNNEYVDNVLGEVIKYVTAG